MVGQGKYLLHSGLVQAPDLVKLPAGALHLPEMLLFYKKIPSQPICTALQISRYFLVLAWFGQSHLFPPKLEETSRKQLQGFFQSQGLPVKVKDLLPLWKLIHRKYGESMNSESLCLPCPWQHLSIDQIHHVQGEKVSQAPVTLLGEEMQFSMRKSAFPSKVFLMIASWKFSPSCQVMTKDVLHR